MAQFTNQAQLRFNDTVIDSNVAVGEIRGALTVSKIAVVDEYTPNDTLTYVVSVINTGATAVAGVTVTDKRVFFLSTSDSGDTRHTNLYVCKTGKTVAEILHWDVSHYLPNVDGSRLVYVDKHGALYGHRLGADPIRLSDTVVAESLCLTADDMFYFCVREGELWVSDNAEGARSVSSGVDRVMADSFTVFYATEMDETGLGKVYSNYRGQRKSELLTERAAWVQ